LGVLPHPRTRTSNDVFRRGPVIKQQINVWNLYGCFYHFKQHARDISRFANREEFLIGVTFASMEFSEAVIVQEFIVHAGQIHSLGKVVNMWA